MKKDYTKTMNYAVVSMIDRSTQDDRKSKVNVEALFKSPAQAEENYIIRNTEIKRYILHVDDLEKFEEFYNHVQDINEKCGENRGGIELYEKIIFLYSLSTGD